MLLSNPYRPDPRVHSEARGLVSAGYEVSLIAWDREQARPRKADEDGVNVHRLGPRCPPRSAPKILFRLPRFWVKALKAARGMKFDVIHAHDFDTLPLGRAISLLHDKPLLYDAHELYAKMVEKEIGPLSRILWRFERRCASQADATVTVSDALASELPPSRLGRATVVSTTQDPSLLNGANATEIRKMYGIEGFVVSYLGSLEPGRFVEETISTFSKDDGVTVLIAGTGTLVDAVKKAAESNPAVRYIGVVPTDEALRLTMASDLVVAMMDPSNPNNVVGTPGKVINAMAVGRALITTRGLDIAKKIEEAGCGFVIRWDRAEFREAVFKAKVDRPGTLEMGIRGRAYYDQHFSWNQSREGLLKAYKALVSPS